MKQILKIAHEKVPSIKEDQFTKIWKFFDKEYFFKLLKSIPERIQAVIKFQGDNFVYILFFCQ